MENVCGINHVTLSVKDLERSVAFYSDLLGFEVWMRKGHSAYLEAGTFWLALVVDENVRSGPLPEYTHLALSVSKDGLPVLKEKLLRAGVAEWQESERAGSFYFLDPDGHKLELHSGTLAERLTMRER
ncbi:VOC family protein [Pedosphaera parvula]|uniref:Glyoxalase/bleomycin resistance protein/dioxygenase n=1 Tax=Pedosphaera parvula (strain Ellin514) TaxID=320771 RepID=B9XJF1_PEDPL|nr:VOC family protein [Pedosphaera parvula]EEF60012.1 Glyoxalase/bleomycin resistance protein/dioxygenase [Pedosphaera parvula Ellin514]